MGKKVPDPTPPRETSAASTATGVSTAIANSVLGNVNEVTPYGTQTFTQTGSTSITDPYTGQTYDVPSFTMERVLSEDGQQIQDQLTDANLNLATLGADLSGTLGEQLTDNFSLGNEATESRLFELGSARLDPLFERRRGDLESRLANQGIAIGSEAYDRAMGNLGEQENDAYNQLLLQGRGQSAQETLAEDNQRINQISALLNGGQVSQPNFSSGPNMPTIPTTDNASIIANNDAQRAQAAMANQGLMGSMLSGLGGLFMLSDERAKEGKKKIAETEDGMGIYSYRYKGDPKTQIGLMAQEVAKKKPDAVGVRPDGLMAVNYEEALQ